MKTKEQFEPKNLVANEFFKEEFLSEFKRLKEDRRVRKYKGFKKQEQPVLFKRDWLDVLDSSGLNDEEKLFSELQNVVAKKSKLPAKTRNIIRAIYSLSLESFTQKMIKAGTNELPDE